MRNDYETRIGKFKGAVDPCTTAFREFPSWVDDQFQLAETDAQVKVHDLDGSRGPGFETQGMKVPSRVAMYCTGGIRCEKASSFLLSKGFKEVNFIPFTIFRARISFLTIGRSCCCCINCS